MISSFWTQCSFWDKVYLVFGAFMVLSYICYLYDYYTDSSKKKMAFIKKASEENTTAIGKLSCLTLHGSKGIPDHYEVEYMYVVDEKSYFVTYRMAYNVPLDDRKDEMNADMMLLSIKPFIILYYDKNNPQKVMCKTEVFTSLEGFSKTKTPKSNIYRDVDKQWTEPIRLT